jgi:large subunit ribosomal protein L1
MTTKVSKRNKAIGELVDKNKEYELSEAIAIIKKGPKTKFDQTVEVAMHLAVEQSTTPIRGTVTLPHGTGKTARVAVFCKGDYEKQAKDAGADVVGSDELIKKVQDGWMEFDVAVATPDMMKDMARLGKVLGPRGLMPNPKSGTVTTEVSKVVKELKGGKIEYRMDKQSGINGAIGKLSFPDAALVENTIVFIKAVMHSSPKLQKIQNIKVIAVSSTMGPGIKLNREQFRIAA